MLTHLIQKYDLRLPRYTSYPTAPHFSAQVDGESYARWLSELPLGAVLSLYLHIAYCADMCWFCGCHTKITQRYDTITDYLDALLAEVDLVAGHLPAHMAASHVHFGGGSPTILRPDDFIRTVDHLRSRFAITEDAEIAVELDPRTADEAYVAAMARVGVTRASIGVQDFNEQVQRAINRIQPYEVTERVVGWLRGHGIAEVNMDLVYGLPHQTAESVVETIDQAVGLKPMRLSLFGYAHVPWMKKHQRLILEGALPDFAERWRQYDMATKRLVGHGYVAIGLDHFAAPDDKLAISLKQNQLHRNFQGYTTDGASVLIGLGASGIGSLPQGYVANEGEVNAYKNLVRSGNLATTRGIPLSADDCLRREIIERLMCDLAVDLDQIAARHGVSGDIFETELASLAALESDGVVVREGHLLRVTDDGRPLIRAVCAVFDRYLVPGEARHSRSV